MSNLSQSSYVAFQSSVSKSLNPKLEAGFHKHNQSSDIKRTHLFQGRYENIYIDDDKIPEIKHLLKEAISLASPLIDCNSLQAGLWFNHMPPGAVTEPHTHDDYDELLSGVYYIRVPENSGKLIIHDKKETIEITPEEGMFVFFKPDVIHEVSENNSNQDRLSVGINFGTKKATT